MFLPATKYAKHNWSVKKILHVFTSKKITYRIKWCPYFDTLVSKLLETTYQEQVESSMRDLSTSHSQDHCLEINGQIALNYSQKSWH